MQSKWGQRFFNSTRGKVVALLRERKHTVDELAQELDLTDNAVRSHISALERDGLVRQDGLRRGVGKPSFDYDLTHEAEELFPKAYRQVLNQLLTVLHADLGGEEATRLMQRIGEQLAPAPLSHDETRQERLERAVSLLAELGGVARIEHQEDKSVIAGNSCPLADVAAEHGEVCDLTAAMIAQYTGLDVCADCDRSGRPRCRFEIAASAAD
jgi:predicted ArsR family transcriptional regulator